MWFQKSPGFAGPGVPFINRCHYTIKTGVSVLYMDKPRQVVRCDVIYDDLGGAMGTLIGPRLALMGLDREARVW